MNTNVTSGNFSSEDVDFTLRFPGIIKKTKTCSWKENIFSGFKLENADSYYSPKEGSVVCHMSRAELFISKAPNCNFAEL